jgi:hypothetical protein
MWKNELLYIYSSQNCLLCFSFCNDIYVILHKLRFNRNLRLNMGTEKQDEFRVFEYVIVI